MFASKEFTDRRTLEYPLGHPPDRVDLAAVAAVDPRVIIFTRSDGPEATPGIFVERDGVRNRLEQSFVLHSPTGMEFGYGGSGPADTALNVLSLVLSPRESWRLHQKFKAEFIATIPREGGEFTMAEVRVWIAGRYAEELADTDRMTDEREMRELLADIENEVVTAEANDAEE